MSLFPTPQSTLDFPQPLSEKYRPRTIAEFIGLEKQKKILSGFARTPKTFVRSARKDSSDMKMRVDFACNDEHGYFMGKAERVDIGDLSLECTLMYSGAKMARHNLHLHIGRLQLPYHGYHYGVGNWCWDGYTLESVHVLKLIHYLEKQKYWTCSEGPEEQYEKFNAKQPFTLEDLRNLSTRS